jgi:hypothetical protein
MPKVLEGVSLEELYDLEERHGVTVGSTASLWAFAPSVPAATLARVARPSRSSRLRGVRKGTTKKTVKA